MFIEGVTTQAITILSSVCIYSCTYVPTAKTLVQRDAQNRHKSVKVLLVSAIPETRAVSLP